MSGFDVFYFTFISTEILFIEIFFFIQIREDANPPVSIFVSYVMRKIRDGIVGIAAGYGLEERGVGVRAPPGSRTFSSPRRPERL
jgi:hypothetical protein